MHIYPILYIQYESIPIRNSPHPNPAYAEAAANGARGGRLGGRGRGVGWGGRKSLMSTFPYCM